MTIPERQRNGPEAATSLAAAHRPTAARALSRRAAPTRPGGGPPRSSTLLVLVVALLLPWTIGATSAPPDVRAVFTGPTGGQVRLGVDLRGDSVQTLGSVSVTVGGVPQPTRVEPLLSNRSVLGLVVDASADARPVLQSGLSGIANFLLTTSTSGSALVSDTTPLAVAAPRGPEPADTLRALTTVSTGGDRQTSAALDRALWQLSIAESSAPRVLLLYTSAPDAGGESVADLVAQLNAVGAVLVVVATATTGPPPLDYWSAVSAGTGGVAVGAPPAEVIAAFDRLPAELRNRWLITVPTPEHLPATAVVRADTAGGQFTVPVAVGPAEPASELSVTRTPLALTLGLGLLVLMATAATALVRYRVGRGTCWTPGSATEHSVMRTPLVLNSALGMLVLLATALVSYSGGRGAGRMPELTPDLDAIRTPLAMTLALGVSVLLATAATALLLYPAGRAAVRTSSRVVRAPGPARTTVPRDRPPGTRPGDSAPAKEPGSSTQPPRPRPKPRTADRRPAAAPRRSTPGAGTRAGNFPARQDGLVARTPLLTAVRGALHRGKPVVLQGRSGSGKTTVIIEFAHRYAADYDITWWVPAEDPELIPDRMAELAEVMGLVDRTVPAEVATARLFEALRGRDRWLIVFDDAESPRELIRYLPTGPGHVVITSPDPGWHGIATPLTVPSITPAEAVGLLRARRPDLSADAAASTATVLDGLPLALDPASALLPEIPMSVATFLRCLDAHWAPVGGEDGTAAAAAAWTVALDRLAADDPGALALLTLAAWLGPEPMPLSLLADNPDALPAPLARHLREPGALAERVATLRRRRLARVGPDSVQLHRLAAGLLLARSAGERTDGEGWASGAVRLLRAGMPEAGPQDPAVWPTWRRLLPLVMAATDPARPLEPVAAEVGWLLSGAAGYLRARGQPRVAQALDDDAHAVYLEHRGHEHSDTRAAADR
jgi:hypothetical protein